MPPLPSVSKVVRVDHHFTLAGDANAQVRMFFQYGGVLSQADALTWANAIATSWGAHMMAQLSNALSLTSTVLTDLSSASAPQAISTTSSTGSLAGVATSGATAIVMKKKIARRYRGGHPRMYIPGPSSGQLATEQTWAAGYIASVNTAFAAYVSDALTNVPAAAAPATEVNVSFFSGFTNKTFPSGRTHPVPTARVTPLVDVIIANTMNPRPANQRRRSLQGS